MRGRVIISHHRSFMALPNWRSQHLRLDDDRSSINSFSSCDIIISSSAFGEGFSNALAEGMASSLIPIATNVGDAKHIVGNTGKVINPKNVLELYNAIKELLELNEQNFITKKILAKNRINENFNKFKMLDSYNQVYNKLLEE